MSSTAETGVLLEHLFRRQAGRIVAHLTRLLGPANLDLAEETVQEAMLLFRGRRRFFARPTASSRTT